MRYLKWAALVLIALIVVVVGGVYGLTELRFRKTYEAPDYPITLHNDAETIARGRHIAVTRGCTGCHGENLGGLEFIDVPILAQLFATNLTSGSGGVGATYSPADWERAIRHGVRPDGKPLLFMPSHEFYPLSDADLSALVSYIRSLPPVDAEKQKNRVGPLGRFLVASRQIPNFVPAELIDHDAPRPAAPAPGVSVEYGAYLATGCTGCHGEQFSGGRIAGAPPEMIAPANITPHETGITHYEEGDFFRVMREGIRPDGSPVNEQMPWRAFGQMSDDELRAIWLYLSGLPPVEFGNR
jgi:cytochrome c553